MTGNTFEVIGIIVVSAVTYITLTGGLAGIIVGDLTDETPMLAWVLGCVITVCLVLLWIFVPCPLVSK